MNDDLKELKAFRKAAEAYAQLIEDDLRDGIDMGYHSLESVEESLKDLEAWSRVSVFLGDIIKNY